MTDQEDMMQKKEDEQVHQKQGQTNGAEELNQNQQQDQEASGSKWQNIVSRGQNLPRDVRRKLKEKNRLKKQDMLVDDNRFDNAIPQDKIESKPKPKPEDDVLLISSQVDEELRLRQVKKSEKEKLKQNQINSKDNKPQIEETKKKKSKRQKMDESDLLMKEEKEQKQKPLTPQQKQIAKKKLRDNIFIGLILGAFLVYVCFQKVMQEKYLKYQRFDLRSKPGHKDLYEVLEVDRSASRKEIKDAQKKMAMKWHPDKNPGCGKLCDEKFAQISEAFEVLKDEDKRRQYDESSGVMTKLRSKAISLTVNNYERLVLDSIDTWIIEVFEDGDVSSERLAPFWEETVEQYMSSGIRFGRIDRNMQGGLLSLLPINVVILPTIFSISQGTNTDIWSFHPSDRNYVQSLKHFVDDSIQNYINFLTASQFTAFKNQKNAQHEQKPTIDLFLLSSANKPSIFVKYQAFKYRNQINFYQNKWGEYVKIEALLQKKSNALIYFNNLETESRTEIAFKFDKLVKADVRGLVNFAKFLTVPHVYKENYADLCTFQNVEDINESSEAAHSNEQSQSTICVLLLSPFASFKQAQIQHVISQFQLSHYKRIQQNLQQRKDPFEHIHSYQMAWLDLSIHRKFRISLLKLASSIGGDFDIDQMYAIAILPESNKVTFLDSLSRFEDWLEDLHEESTKLEYHYLNNILGEEEVQQQLKKEFYSIYKSGYRYLLQNVFDYKQILLIFLIIAIVAYFKKITMQKCTKYIIIIHGIMSVIFTFLTLIEEVF